MEIQGKALIVGVGGIGREVALTLALHGATTLICADLNVKAAQKLAGLVRQSVADSGRAIHVSTLQVDVTKEESVQQLVDHVKSQHGRIDYFVNCSGFGAVGQKPISSYALDDYRGLNEVHHIGTFLLLRAVTACMLQQDPRTVLLPRRQPTASGRSESRGVIFILASLASEGGYIGVAPYVAAKHAVVGLVQTCALENGPKGIRINVVSPSYVAGPMINKYLDKAPDSRATILGDLPLGRLADPEEVADTVVFLCSGLSSYINGHTLIVDGGASVALAKGVY